MADSGSHTIFVGNLSESVTEDLIYELFLQAGPLESVRIPVQNGRRRAFGFVKFKHEKSVPYAARLFQDTSLYGRTLNLQYKKPPGRCLMKEQMLNVFSNPLMSRLGPPVTTGGRFPLPLPISLPPPSYRNPCFSHKRMPTHLMPSPAKKRVQEDEFDKNHIPDSINYRGLIGKEDSTKRKTEKINEDDLRSKIKKKKKKKNKDKERTSSKKSEEKEDLTRGGSNFDHYPPKSYFKNAVNQIKQHCSRNSRGSYDLNSKLKLPKHLRFNT